MTQEELKLVRDVLEQMGKADVWQVGNAIAAINKALAQHDSVQAKPEPEQKPVAWKLPDKNVVFWEDTKEVDEYHGFEPTIPLYPHPQRTWQGLTDKAITQVIDSMPKNMKGFMVDWDLYEFAQTIEAKLKQKNGYAEENT